MTALRIDPIFTITNTIAGAFGEDQRVEPDGWVAPKTLRKLGEGMFVA